MIFCLTVDDVCLEGYSTEEHTENLLRFFEEEHIQATFFAVPKAEGTPIQKMPGYVELLKNAVAEGHEVAQHGLEHDRFETGIPPRMILDLPHEEAARSRLEREREAIEDGLHVSQLRSRLSLGRQMLEEAIGIEVGGFRAPCLSVCDNLFAALAEERYEYDSSTYLQEGGWDLLQGKPLCPRPIRREHFDGMQQEVGLRSLPLTTEYTWYLWQNAFAATMALAQHDVVSCLRADIPFITLAHVSPLNECENNCGFDFYRRLIDYARKQSAEIQEELQLLSVRDACRSFFSA